MRINGAKVTGIGQAVDDGILPVLAQKGGTPKENWKVIQNIRANAKIPSAPGVWEDMDEEVMRAYEQEAKLVEDIRGQGLTQNHQLEKLFSSYRVSSLMTDADVDMSGEVYGDEDRIDYKTRSVPVPVIHKEFKVGWREAQDVSQDNLAEATRAVTRALEALAWGGEDWTVEGNALDGIKDSGTSGDWGGAGDWATASNAYEEVINAIQTLKNNGFGAPYNLYVDQDYMDDLMELRSNTVENYVDIIESLDDINAVRFTDNADSAEAYLVSMSRRAIDMAISQFVTPVNWSTGPDGRVTQYQVFAVAAPRLKSDYAGNNGVNINTDISS